MATLSPTNVTTTDLTNTLADYTVDPKATDSVSGQDEFFWDNSKATQWHGYYKSIPELKKAIDALSLWTFGRGYSTDPHSQVLLDHIIGIGEDSFLSFLSNMLICKKVYGDAFAEVIRDDKGLLLNLKVLDPAKVRIKYNSKGLITGYVVTQGQKQKPFKKEEIFHISNERHADEVHGVSVIEACEQIILMRNEAMTDWKKVLHRNVVPLKIVEVDTDDTTKIQSITTQLQNQQKNIEWLVVPKGNVSVEIPNVPLNDPIAWIQYLEQVFYFAVGIPKSALGGSETFTESTAKVGLISFEQVYIREMREMEQDLWNQLYIRVKFNEPTSLLESEMVNEQKNTGQVGMQPNDATLTAGGRGG